MMPEKSLEPTVDKWEEYTKPEYIEELIFYICEDIVRRGYRSRYNAAYDALYVHIHENIEKYYPEEDDY